MNTTANYTSGVSIPSIVREHLGHRIEGERVLLTVLELSTDADGRERVYVTPAEGLVPADAIARARARHAAGEAVVRVEVDATAETDAATAAVEHPAWCARRRCVIPGRGVVVHRSAWDWLCWEDEATRFDVEVRRVRLDGFEEVELRLLDGSVLAGSVEHVRKLGAYLAAL